MLNSDVLEVAIGLVFIYLLLSLIATSAREAIESILKGRSKQLEQGLVELFDAQKQPQLMQAFYDQPLINALYRGAYAPPANVPAPATPAGTPTVDRTKVARMLPSYIPSSSFALAVLDLVVSRDPATSKPPAPATPDANVPATASPPLTMADLRAAADDLLDGNFADVVRLAIKTSENLSQVQAFLESWFDSAMDRVSGLYRRRTQAWVFAISALMCIVLNVNTVVIAQALAQNQALRAAVAADAEGAAKNSAFTNAITNAAQATNAINVQVDQIERIEGLPLGWADNSWSRIKDMATLKCATGGCTWRAYARTGLGYLEILAGWLITAFAIMLGAPFWFDVLNKIMVVRSTVKPAEKSGDEASKDATPAKGS